MSTDEALNSLAAALFPGDDEPTGEQPTSEHPDDPEDDADARALVRRLFHPNH